MFLILKTVDGLQAGTIVSRFFGNNQIGVGSNYKGWNNCMKAARQFKFRAFLFNIISATLFFLDKKLRKVAFTIAGVIVFILVFPFLDTPFGVYWRLLSFVIDKGKHNSIIINYEPSFLNESVWAMITGFLLYIGLLVWTYIQRKKTLTIS